jgi:hypothetical protein
MAAEAFSIFEIQAFLGHEDPKTTAQYVSGSVDRLRSKLSANPLFGEHVQEDAASPEVQASLEARISGIEAALATLLERTRASADGEADPFGRPPEEGDAVGHEGQTVASEQAL